MKKIIPLLFTILFVANLFGQQMQYHRLKIKIGKDGLMQLAKQGVAVDHGAYKKGDYFIARFSTDYFGK